MTTYLRKLFLLQSAFFLLVPVSAKAQLVEGERQVSPSPDDTLRMALLHPLYSLPAKRPTNFAFRIGFPPHYMGDVLDTFNGTFKRDLVDRDSTISFHLSAEQLDIIYQKMLKIDLFNYRNVLTFGEMRRTKCVKVFDIKVLADSVKRDFGNIPCSGRYKQDVNALDELSDMIARMIYSSDEYKKLPKPTSGRL
jgi:hypothetical protein